MRQPTTWLDHPEGRVGIEELGRDRRRIRVEDSTTFISSHQANFRLGLYNSINNAAWHVQYDDVKVGVP